jgi:hypothetical protein
MSDLAYFVAGYDQNYTAQTTVFTIDPVASTANSALVISRAPSLPTARGDLSAIAATDVSTGKKFALVTGGFTHENSYCTPLSTSERFDPETGVWTDTNDLAVSRGDTALVVLGENRIFALGGERDLPNFCLLSDEEKPEPGEETLPIVDVEWYDETVDKWTVIEDLPRHRFRFAAVGYKDAIYSFGGQLALDKNCSCFKTSDEVIVYKEEFESSPSKGNSPSTSAGVQSGMFASMAFMFGCMIAS